MELDPTIIAVILVIIGTLMGGAFVKFISRFVWSRRDHYIELARLGWTETDEGRVRPRSVDTGVTEDREAKNEDFISWIESRSTPNDRDDSAADLVTLVNVIWYFRLSEGWLFSKRSTAPKICGFWLI